MPRLRVAQFCLSSGCLPPSSASCGCLSVVAGVAEEGSVGVGPGGWPGPGHAVQHLDLPGAVGDFCVVPRAEEGQVVDVGVAVVGPGCDVVDVAEVAGGGAAGDDAADVPGVEGCFLGG